MNHQSTITPLVTNQPIPSSDLKRALYGCHQDINFSDLLNGLNRRDARNTDQFLHREGITFRDYVGCQFLTGNELVYYPELAKKLRAIEDYPLLKRCYQVDTRVKGLALLKCFYEAATQHLKDFQREWEHYSNQVDACIERHGHARYLPLIDHMEIDKVPYSHHEEGYWVKGQALIIHGVQWHRQPRTGEKP